MSSQDESLKERVRDTVSNLSDEELVQMLEAPYDQYTTFALDVARAELGKRGGKEIIEKRIAEGIRAYPPFQNPWNYLIWAIVVTLCCFPPTGIVAIVYAVQAKEKFDKGNFADGVKTLQKSRRWSLASVVVVAALIIIQLAILLLGWLLERGGPVSFGRQLATMGG
jgi:hypothetical protein